MTWTKLRLMYTPSVSKQKILRMIRSVGVRVLQMDFAMNYACEYQNEVQSALWSRESVMLFTAAVILNGQS